MSTNIALPIMDVPEAVRQLKEAAAAKKCWSCGCLHGSLDAIESSISEQVRPAELRQVLREARSKLVAKKYDCLGCEVCYPPLAMNALDIGADACPQDDVEAREGWPPLPGSYQALRLHGCVAVCTLTDENQVETIARCADPSIAMVGSVYTENLGIERIITNVLANPNIRFLILCGPDSKQKIGHLPGQSMLALAKNGLDESGRIIEARGKRPVLKNVDAQAVAHFRHTVEVVDLVGQSDLDKVLRCVAECAARNPGPAQPFASGRSVETLHGYLPGRMVSDRAGYFVIYPDRARQLLVLEHYGNNGVLDLVIEGRSPAELYIPAIERELVTRLDHAAYLGRELTRAAAALTTNQTYVQDAAPEKAACGCGSACNQGDEHEASSCR